MSLNRVLDQLQAADKRWQQVSVCYYGALEAVINVIEKVIPHCNRQSRLLVVADRLWGAFAANSPDGHVRNKSRILRANQGSE